MPPKGCQPLNRGDLARREDRTGRGPQPRHRFSARVRAGKHVLCEKPMATSSADAKAMVAACEKAAVKLMVAYRIQYETYNRRLARFVRERTFGRLLGFEVHKAGLARIGGGLLMVAGIGLIARS